MSMTSEIYIKTKTYSGNPKTLKKFCLRIFVSTKEKKSLPIYIHFEKVSFAITYRLSEFFMKESIGILNELPNLEKKLFSNFGLNFFFQVKS